jgi:hypothetical protein
VDEVDREGQVRGESAVRDAADRVAEFLAAWEATNGFDIITESEYTARDYRVARQAHLSALRWVLGEDQARPGWSNDL